jgi:hypothetical protein
MIAVERANHAVAYANLKGPLPELAARLAAPQRGVVPSEYELSGSAAKRGADPCDLVYAVRRSHNLPGLYRLAEADPACPRPASAERPAPEDTRE